MTNTINGTKIAIAGPNNRPSPALVRKHNHAGKLLTRYAYLTHVVSPSIILMWLRESPDAFAAAHWPNADLIAITFSNYFSRK
jgi:hypothetical protein